MTDTWGDGWNGNVFAFQQLNQYVATFGEGFTAGFNLSKNVTIPAN